MSDYSEELALIRKLASFIVQSGYRPKQDSNNPLEAVLFEALALIKRKEAA